MPLITITSDLGIKDFYVAALKGAIITHCGYVPIIDISHSVRHFDIKEAAFLIGNGYKYFPKGTIHIVHVGSNEARGKLLVAIIDGYYFITFDNGILSMVFDKTFPQQVYQVNEELLENHTLLYEDAIAKVIGLLLQEYRLSDFGQPLTETVHYRLLQPITTQGGLKGSVIYIDHFGNAVVNITRKIFYEFVGERNFTVSANVAYTKVISKTFSETEEGEMVCIFNSAGYLEVAMNKGKAEQLMGLKIGSVILVATD